MMLYVHSLDLLEPRGSAAETAEVDGIRCQLCSLGADFGGMLTDVTSLGKGGSKPAATAFPVLVPEDMPGL